MSIELQGHFKKINDEFGEEAEYLIKAILSSFSQNGIGSEKRKAVQQTGKLYDPTRAIGYDLIQRIKNGELRLQRKENIDFLIYKDRNGKDEILDHRDLNDPLLINLLDIVEGVHNSLNVPLQPREELRAALGGVVQTISFYKGFLSLPS